MKLSILIPSLYKRQILLSSLLAQIANQDTTCLIHTEVITSIDGGVKSIGQKRNELLQKATGDYVVFIDDDDNISKDYLERIFEGINKGVDHIGIAMSVSLDGKLPKVCLNSKYYVWEEKNNIYYRGVQHVCAIKREIAQAVKYPEINFGEDKVYSEIITPLINTEHLITEPIYFYNFKSNK